MAAIGRAGGDAAHQRNRDVSLRRRSRPVGASRAARRLLAARAGGIRRGVTPLRQAENLERPGAIRRAGG